MKKNEVNACENAGRRKVIKSLVGGVSAVTAYSLFPAKWSSPLVESVFLPAHAATSNINTSNGNTVKSGYFSVTTRADWGESKLCIEINGNTATVYGFDPDPTKKGKYLTGKGAVSSASITANVNQNGEAEPDGSYFTVSGISSLTTKGGIVTVGAEGKSYNVPVSPQTSSCK